MSLYDRKVELVMARAPVDAGWFTFVDSRTIRNLRVTFDVMKTLESTSNKATITVTNLSSASRAEAEQLPMHVTLSAGYKGNLVDVFTGDVFSARSERSGPDWITSMQFGEGNRAIRNARVHLSFKAGVSSKTVITAIASSLNVKVPTSFADATEFVQQFSAGVSLRGPSSDAMTAVLKRHGMTWSIQNNQLQILRENDTRTDAAWLLTPDNGMIGSPTFGTPDKKGKPPVLTVKSLLYGNIYPGGQIQVESRKINGTFKALTVRHVGDVSGKDWYTTIEAVSVL